MEGGVITLVGMVTAVVSTVDMATVVFSFSDDVLFAASVGFKPGNRKILFRKATSMQSDLSNYFIYISNINSMNGHSVWDIQLEANRRVF